MTFFRFFQNFSDNLGIKNFAKFSQNREEIFFSVEVLSEYYQELRVLPPNLTAEIFFSKFEFPNLYLGGGLRGGGGCQNNLSGCKFDLQLRMPKSFQFKRYDDFGDF